MQELLHAEQLMMRWLPVVDGRGRTQMVATWISVPVGADVASHSVHHAA